MRRRLLLLALAATAVNARAGSAIRALESASKEKASRPAPTLARDPGECARDKRCWRLVTIGFRELLPSHVRIVEAALPNHFFPRAVTFAYAGVRKGTGRFLHVRCDQPRKPGKRVNCEDKTIALERRVLAATLLASLPLGRPSEELFDGRFIPTAAGAAAFGKVEGARPDVWGELRELAAQSLGVTEHDMPASLR